MMASDVGVIFWCFIYGKILLKDASKYISNALQKKLSQKLRFEEQEKNRQWDHEDNLQKYENERIEYSEDLLRNLNDHRASNKALQNNVSDLMKTIGRILGYSDCNSKDDAVLSKTRELGKIVRPLIDLRRSTSPEGKECFEKQYDQVVELIDDIGRECKEIRVRSR